MSHEDSKKVTKRPMSLLLTEGCTDQIFYDSIKASHLANCRVTVRDLHGLYNVNVKVIKHILDYVQHHRDETVRVYCCLDRESRYGNIPGFDIKTILKYVKDANVTSVLSVDLITATQQIESWFFHDIDGIFKYLEVPKAQRNVRAFGRPEKFSYKDIQKLFERYGKTYAKGKRAENFINNLDNGKIVRSCKELREGIQLIQSQAGDLTNRLFPAKKPIDN